MTRRAAHTLFSEAALSMGEITHRRLAKLPVQVLADAIADAVSEVAGEPFTASVRRLDLQPVANADLADEYELTVRIRRYFQLPSEGSQSGEQRAGDRDPEEDLDQVLRDRTVTGPTGRQLNAEWSVGARHALYHHEGRWYHKLRRFPGALFDFNGYVLFESQNDFEKCQDLAITQDVHVSRGIASMSRYVRVR